MSHAPCTDTWKVEARLDGRLDGVDGAMFDAHAMRCSACAAEKAALDALYAEVRAMKPSPLAPLDRARQGKRLLERANARFVGAEEPPRRGSAWTTAALALATAIAVVVVVRLLTVRPTTVTVRPDDELSTPAMPVVVVPPIVPASSAAASVPTSSGNAAHMTHATSSVSTARRAGERFDGALATFARGDYENADRLFGEFERAFPSDERCEDAAFLRAVSLARLGDDEGARTRARAYLNAYPTGLRRTEALRIEERGTK